MIYDVVSKTNIPIFSMLTENEHKDADTLFIPHCHDVAKRDLFWECVEFSSDTDVFLLVINDLQLSPWTCFRTGQEDQLRNITISQCYEAIGPVQATALLGFHTLIGSDQTGRFNRKIKLFWWKQFYCAGENVLAAMAELCVRMVNIFIIA